MNIRSSKKPDGSLIELLNNMISGAAGFVKDIPQDDHLTMMAVRYKVRPGQVKSGTEQKEAGM